MDGARDSPRTMQAFIGVFFLSLRAYRSLSVNFYHWEPVDHLQGSLGPPQKSLKKKSPGASGPGTPPRVWKSLEKVWRVWKKSRKGPDRLFRDFFQTLGGRRSRETFFRLFRGFGPRGPERPLKMVNGFPILSIYCRNMLLGFGGNFARFFGPPK